MLLALRRALDLPLYSESQVDFDSVSRIYAVCKNR